MLADLRKWLRGVEANDETLNALFFGIASVGFESLTEAERAMYSEENLPLNHTIPPAYRAVLQKVFDAGFDTHDKWLLFAKFEDKYKAIIEKYHLKYNAESDAPETILTEATTRILHSILKKSYHGPFFHTYFEVKIKNAVTAFYKKQEKKDSPDAMNDRTNNEVSVADSIDNWYNLIREHLNDTDKEIMDLCIKYQSLDEATQKNINKTNYIAQQLGIEAAAAKKRRERFKVRFESTAQKLGFSVLAILCCVSSLLLL